jgi:hypothetical protein
MVIGVGALDSAVPRRAGGYRKTRPNRYPIPKNTRITTATITATNPTMVRKLG